MKTKILAIDWGTKRIGVAISDESKTIATPLPTLTVNSLKGVLYKLRQIIYKENVRVIVLGIPKKLDGSESDSTIKAKIFGHKLISPFIKRKRKIQLFYADETLSSWEAKAILKELGKPYDKESGRIDQIVAASLLQDYLDRKKIIIQKKIAKRLKYAPKSKTSDEKN